MSGQMNELIHTQAPSFSLSPAPESYLCFSVWGIHSEIPTQPGSLCVL